MKNKEPRTIHCTICNQAEHVRPYKNGYICEECVRYMISRYL